MTDLARAGLLLAVTLGAGALGAVIRAAASGRAPRAGVHVANILGTFVLALALNARRDGSIDSAAVVVVGAGFAGALTTFSGWVALAVERARVVGRVRAGVIDVAVPLAVATALTVLTFARS